MRHEWELAVKTVEGGIGSVQGQVEKLQVQRGHGGVWVSGDLPS
jgi:hypothetical protein